MITTQQNDWRSRHENAEKLAALILAATMVLVLFTACGGDTTSTPEAQAEAQMMSTKWTQVGVVVKAVNGQTYMAISVAIDTNA